MAEIIWDDREVQKSLDNLIAGGLNKYLLRGMKKACGICEREVKQNCPVDDGTLRKSITHWIEEEADGVMGYIGTNVEYAPYVHYGTGIYAVNGDGRKEVPWKYQTADGKWHTTSGQKPNPFMQKAIDAKQGEVLECFEGLL